MKELVVMPEPYTGPKWDAIKLCVFSLQEARDLERSPKFGIGFQLHEGQVPEVYFHSGCEDFDPLALARLRTIDAVRKNRPEIRR